MGRQFLCLQTSEEVNHAVKYFIWIFIGDGLAGIIGIAREFIGFFFSSTIPFEAAFEECRRIFMHRRHTIHVGEIYDRVRIYRYKKKVCIFMLL